MFGFEVRATTASHLVGQCDFRQLPKLLLYITMQCIAHLPISAALPRAVYPSLSCWFNLIWEWFASASRNAMSFLSAQAAAQARAVYELVSVMLTSTPG